MYLKQSPSFLCLWCFLSCLFLLPAMWTRSREGIPTLQSLQNVQLEWMCPILSFYQWQSMNCSWLSSGVLSCGCMRRFVGMSWPQFKAWPGFVASPFDRFAQLIRATFPRLLLWTRSFWTPSTSTLLIISVLTLSASIFFHSYLYFLSSHSSLDSFRDVCWSISSASFPWSITI